MVITLKIEDRVIGEIKKKGGTRYLLKPCIVLTLPIVPTTPPPTPPSLHKGVGGGGSFNFSKIDTNGEGLKIFSRK